MGSSIKVTEFVSRGGIVEVYRKADPSGNRVFFDVVCGTSQVDTEGAHTVNRMVPLRFVSDLVLGVLNAMKYIANAHRDMRDSGVIPAVLDGWSTKSVDPFSDDFEGYKFVESFTSQAVVCEIYQSAEEDDLGPYVFSRLANLRGKQPDTALFIQQRDLRDLAIVLLRASQYWDDREVRSTENYNKADTQGGYYAE